MQQSKHRLLQRQLKRYLKDLEEAPPEWQQFLDAVNNAYHQADDDRARMERTLELSSQELMTANTELQQVLASVEQQVKERTAALTVANDELAETLQQLQQAQLKLVQVEKMSSLGQLVAGVAHELNNPLTFIDGNLHYISDYMSSLLAVVDAYQQVYPEPVPTVQDALEQADFEFVQADMPKVLTSLSTGTKRIGTIVQSLRTFSRLDEAEVKWVDIHECLDSTLLLLTSQLRHGRAIQMHCHYGELPIVECYAGHLNQVFLNILTNAIDVLKTDAKFESETPTWALSGFKPLKGGLQHQDWALLLPEAQPAIHVVTELVDNQLEVRILDNGPGIPMEIRDRIFDPFFTTKTVGEGTGLGLSTSYQAVMDLHGGSLSCRSTPGIGTVFVIRVPLRQTV